MERKKKTEIKDQNKRGFCACIQLPLDINPSLIRGVGIKSFNDCNFPLDGHQWEECYDHHSCINHRCVSTMGKVAQFVFFLLPCFYIKGAIQNVQHFLGP